MDAVHIFFGVFFIAASFGLLQTKYLFIDDGSINYLMLTHSALGFVLGMVGIIVGAYSDVMTHPIIYVLIIIAEVTSGTLTVIAALGKPVDQTTWIQSLLLMAFVGHSLYCFHTCFDILARAEDDQNQSPSSFTS